MNFNIGIKNILIIQFSIRFLTINFFFTRKIFFDLLILKNYKFRCIKLGIN